MPLGAEVNESVSKGESEIEGLKDRERYEMLGVRGGWGRALTLQPELALLSKKQTFNLKLVTPCIQAPRWKAT